MTSTVREGAGPTSVDVIVIEFQGWVECTEPVTAIHLTVDLEFLNNGVWEPVATWDGQSVNSRVAQAYNYIGCPTGTHTHRAVNRWQFTSYEYPLDSQAGTAVSDSLVTACAIPTIRVDPPSPSV